MYLFYISFNREYTSIKARESYAMNNAIGWSREERWAGRPTKRVSGIYDKLKARGAEFGFHAGMTCIM